MKLRHPLLFAAGGFLGATAAQAWLSTLDVKGVYYDPEADPMNSAKQDWRIFVFWHEYLLFPLNIRRDRNMSLLISRHADAEVLSRAATHLGFGIVRGSTRRGGAAALRELARKARNQHLVITPDGPRGPRRQMAAGPIYLASRLEMPIVLVAAGYDRPWRAPTWDRFAIPRPFSRARGILSPTIHVPSDLDRDGIEHYRRRVEALLNRLTSECEAWAEAGTSKVGEFVVRRQNMTRRAPEQSSPHRVVWPDGATDGEQREADRGADGLQARSA